MDGNLFDRVAKTLAGIAPRREAVRALAGTGLAATAGLGIGTAGAKKKKKKKTCCTQRGRSCTSAKECCDESGLVRCQEFPESPQGGDCRALRGFHCCGLEGASCDPTFGEPEKFGNCDCCPPLYCGEQPNGKFRCQTEDT